MVRCQDTVANLDWIQRQLSYWQQEYPHQDIWMRLSPSPTLQRDDTSQDILWASDLARDLAKFPTGAAKLDRVLAELKDIPSHTIFGKLKKMGLPATIRRITPSAGEAFIISYKGVNAFKQPDPFIRTLSVAYNCIHFFTGRGLGRNFYRDGDVATVEKVLASICCNE